MDVITAEAQPHPRDEQAPAPLGYAVRSLSPSRRYRFAIECRYLRVPALLAATATSRLELVEPLPCREPRWSVVADSFVVAVSLTLDPDRGHAWSPGFHLRLRWRFCLESPSATLPPMLSYQVACTPLVGAQPGVALAKATLLPGLLVERSRGGDSRAVFSVDPSCDVYTALVELPGASIEPLTRRMPTRLAVRVGDPSSGTWSPWSDQVNDPVSLALAHPVPADAPMVLKEELWRSECFDSPVAHAPHAVKALTVCWQPFVAEAGTSKEHHELLTKRYEVTLWVIDSCAPSLEEVHSVLRVSTPMPSFIREAFRQVVVPDLLQCDGTFAHTHEIPGEHLQAGKYHYVRILAHYVFAEGCQVPEPVAAQGCRPGVLISPEPLLPVPHRLRPPILEPGGMHVTAVSATSARVAWRPFSVPCREDVGSADPPLVLEEGAALGPGLLTGEYEVLVHEGGKNLVSVLRHDGLVMFDEIARGYDPAWLDVEAPLEPHKGYTFEIHARFRGGPWGPSVRSAPLPPRLLPISVGMPIVDLTLRQAPDGGARFEAVVHVECSLRGFVGGPAQCVADSRVPAAIAQYQLRSCSAATGASPCAPGSAPEVEEAAWMEWPTARASAAHAAAGQALLLDVLLAASPVPLEPGRAYVFGLRCADEFGRWTAWSTESERVCIVAPRLVPPQVECPEAGSSLRLTQRGSRAALLEWSQFRPDWRGASIQKGMSEAIEKVSYRLRMAKRLGSSFGEWVSVPLAEFSSERRSTATVTYEVEEMDERFEYYFYVSARWMNLPPPLQMHEWTPEISSALLPARLQELHAPDAPWIQVHASETGGLAAGLKWWGLRNKGLLARYARHQVRFAAVPCVEVGSPGGQGSRMLEWTEEPVVLEGSEDAVAQEMGYVVKGLAAGGTYKFSVRVGDAYRWSGWSPPSEACSLVVPAPVPIAGDVLQLTFGNAATDAAALEWRPFRTSHSLARVEYKVMALEWPSEEGLAQVGGHPPASSRTFRVVGYVTGGESHAAQLRQEGARVRWKTEGLRPGLSYRFFVCARYPALPLGAVAPLPRLLAEPKAVAWPDEHCERLRAEPGEGVAWEASLSRVGLWSQTLTTVHLPHYAVRPCPPPALSMPGAVASAAASGRSVGVAPLGGGGREASVAAVAARLARGNDPGSSADSTGTASGSDSAGSGAGGGCCGGCVTEEWMCSGASGGAGHGAVAGSAANAARTARRGGNRPGAEPSS